MPHRLCAAAAHNVSAPSAGADGNTWFTKLLKSQPDTSSYEKPGQVAEDAVAHPANHMKAIAYVLFAILVWSGWVVVSRAGVKGVLSPYDITAIRFTTAGLLLLPVVFKRGWSIGPWGWKSSLLISVLIGACYTNVVITGMQYAPVSHASTVNTGTFLILITVVGIHGLREHVSKLRLFGVFCSLLGIGFMLLAKGNESSGSQQWIGHLCFMTGGALWGSYVLLARAWRLDPTHAAAIICVFSMITYMPLYLLFAHSHIPQSSWQELTLQVIYQGVLTSIIALVAFNIGVSILGAARSGAFVPLIPALSTLLAIPVLHEVPSFIEIVGISAVSVGVFLASGSAGWKHFRKRPS